MNATKALLECRGVAYGEHHGIRAHNVLGSSGKLTLANEGVKLLQRGVAPALSTYLGELEPQTQHSLESLFFNLPCVHRTFCLTYTSQKDLFIPLTDCRLVYDSGNAFVVAKLSKDFVGKQFIKRLPPSLKDAGLGDAQTIVSAAKVSVASQVVKSAADVAQVQALLRTLRPDLQYLAGAETLWYAKGVVSGPSRLQRSPLTCSLMAMHRLSEICRYKPMQLAAFLAGQKNWLLTEFIRMSPIQFLDEISCEITGQQFMIPNARMAT